MDNKANLKRYVSTRKMVLCAMFTALTAIGAFIRIPVPIVPFTLQLLFTTLAGLLLGSKLGGLAVLVYVCMGLIGFPVFTEGGGLFYFMKPTFGYLLGFAGGAFLTGYIAEQRENPDVKWLIFADFAGLAVVYLMGLIHCYLITGFYLGTLKSLWTLFYYGFILAVPGDIVICVVAAFIAKKLLPVLRKI